MSELLDVSAHVAVDDDGNVIHPDDAPDLSPPVINTDTFGEAMEQIIREETHAEATRQLQEVAKVAGPSVALALRAEKLIETIDHASDANRLSGYLQAGRDIRDPEAIARKESSLRRHGEEAFKQAFGYGAMLAAGYAEEGVVSDFTDEYGSFKDEHLRPGTSKERAKLKKRLQTPPKQPKHPYPTVRVWQAPQ